MSRIPITGRIKPVTGRFQDHTRGNGEGYGSPLLAALEVTNASGEKYLVGILDESPVHAHVYQLNGRYDGSGIESYADLIPVT